VFPGTDLELRCVKEFYDYSGIKGWRHEYPEWFLRNQRSRRRKAKGSA
jgi:hypothetical protein